MKCHVCQAENRIDRLYCEECGAKLEHDLADVQAAVDREVREEKAKATARAARWLFAVSIVLFLVGRAFRGAYKDLPDNDVIAFAAAPTIDIDERITVAIDQFGVDLPRPTKRGHVAPAPVQRIDDEELKRDAYNRAAVTLKHKGNAEPIDGILLGDLVFYAKLPGQDRTVPVHIADVRRLHPRLRGNWEIRAVNLKGPVEVSVPDAAKIKIQILEPKAGDEPRLHTIPLTTIEYIRALAEGA